MPHEIERALQGALDAAGAADSSPLRRDEMDRIVRVMKRTDSGNKAVAEVLVTLFAKKIISPEQDIRLHQAGMEGGFSGRGLDEKYVNPFLRENDFPRMGSGSGWLTRSLEHAAPYDLEYTGKIKPAQVKDDFLRLIDAAQKKDGRAEQYLVEMFKMLLRWREQSQNLSLSRPKNKSINAAIALVESLWLKAGSGAARIPVVAVYAAYQRLVREVGRYENHKLLPLLPHNAADEKTGRAGDIDIALDDKIVEAVEIKHGAAIDAGLVSAIIDKVRRTSVRRCYILSANETLQGAGDIARLAADARQHHGCEVIANGIASTLKYYLRLISNPDDFTENFVSLLEKDPDINYATKLLWNEIVEGETK